MIDGWNCRVCKQYNDILTNHCAVCKANSPDYVTTEYQARIEIRRGIFIALIGLASHEVVEINRKLDNGEEVTPQEELFAKFYNQEKILVKDMDNSELREHRETLAAIAFEAKARLVSADDETRDRHANSKNKDWLVTSETHETDHINAPKVRSARMSKMDKTRAQLLAAGIDEDTVNEMVKNLERRATEKNLTAVTFNKPAIEQAVIVVEAKKSTAVEEVSKEPFDPSNLFGPK